MVNPLALLNQASYPRRGVTFQPPVRIPARPVVVRPPVVRGTDADPRQTAAAWLTPNMQAIANYTPPRPESNADGGGGLAGLGYVIGKPLEMGLKALSVFDYPRAAVTGTVRQLLDTEAVEQLNRAVAKLPGIDYTPINQAEGDTPGFDWNELWRDIKTHEGFGTSIIQPNFEDSNIWLRRGLGFAGDVAADPFSYLSAGTKALMGGAARSEYANTLLDTQQAVARDLARNQGVVERLSAVSDQPVIGYGNWAKQQMGAQLAQAERAVPELLQRQAALGDISDIERIGRQGVNIANPAQLRAMGIGDHAVRWGGIEIPRTEAISRGVSRLTGPVKERLTASAPARGLRSLRTPVGEANQELSRAMERILTGEGTMTMERALRTIKLDQWIREGGSTFRGFAAHAMRQLDQQLAGMDGAERAALMQAADVGEDNIVAAMGPRMIAAAKEAGVELPQLQGQQYVPHVLTREAFNFLDKMRQGKNPLVDEFRRKMGIRAEDLLEEGGFLQKRIFRPTINADGTVTPFKMKIGSHEIEIVRGDLAELEDKLGGVLREAGFEGKLYETDPVEAYKRYIISTERDVGKRYSGKRAARAGYEGFTEVPQPPGPESYDPITQRPILPSGPGEPGRTMAVANPQAKPRDTDLFEYVTDEAATEARNRELARKAPRGKQAKGRTQREIQAELEALGQAERENLAERIDATAAAAWDPHREAIQAAKAEERAARDQVAEVERIVGGQRATIEQIDNAIAEADRQIASLQSRIGGITSQARRRVEVQSQALLDGLNRELDAAIAERQRLMRQFNDAIERADKQLPAAQRRAAVREVNEPIRRERHLRRALSRAKRVVTKERERAENILRGESLDPKTGKSRWITAQRAREAQSRLDDPRLQAQYNGLIQERLNLIDRRLRILDEAADLDRQADDATSAANRVADDFEEERLLQQALDRRRAANERKGEAARMLDTINGVQQRIQNHAYTRDSDLLRRWNKQQRDIDNFRRSIPGGDIDVAGRRQQVHQADLALEDFLRQKMHEAQFQANPPPTNLTEFYERELPQATSALESERLAEFTDKTKRLAEVDKQLAESPAPKPGDVQVPKRDLVKRGSGSYEMRVGEGELDRYSVEHIVIPASEAPAGYGRVDYWAVSYPGERVPDVAATSLKQARQQIDQHIHLQAYGEALRNHNDQVQALTAERQQLVEWLRSNELRGEEVARAERVTEGAATHTARQAEIEALQRTVDESAEVYAKQNARDDLQRVLQEPEPKWAPPQKRAEFEAQHAAWETRQKRAKRQLGTVNRQLREMGDRVNRAEGARRKLNELIGAAEREFANVPVAQRPPWFRELSERNAANLAEAADVQAQLQRVARQVEPAAAEAVAQEKTLAAQLGRAALGPAEETAEGVPTTAEGIAMQIARGSGEAPGAMEEVASARQRIEQLHAGIKMNEADRTAVEDMQAAWFAPYNQGIENQQAARARYKNIEQRAEGLRKPVSAQTTIEGKRGGRPYGSQLKLVGPDAAREARPGGIVANVGSPAYEAQPMYRTIQDVNKVVAANPTGDDALMNRIEAELGNHLTHLDQLTRQYDLPAYQLKNIIRAANDGTLAPVLKRQLKDGFEYLWEGGDIVIDKELRRIYFNVSKQLDSKLLGRTFTMLTDFFKTYATLSPGFHVRNALSAIFMNSSEDVTLKTQMRAVQLWRQFVEADDAVAWMRTLRETNPAAADAFRATFGSGAGGQFMERGVSELRQGGARINERIFANRLTRASQRFGANWVEGPVRLALALDSTTKGMTVTDAINRVTRVHFDYGQVSRFDERAKRVIPFWTFMSRNVPLQFTQMWTKPRTYLRYQSFVRNMQLGVEEDPLIPQYIKEAGGFDTGIRTPGWMRQIPFAGNLLPPEGMPVVLQPDLPHTRLQDDINRFAAAAGGQNPGQALSDINPFFTAPFEYAMGKDFFTGKEYGPEDWSQAQGLGTPLAIALAAVGGGKRGPDGQWYLQDKALNALRSLVPPIDRTARLTPGLIEAEPENSDRMLESYLRFLGMPVRTISDDQKQSELANRYYRTRDAALTRAATGG